MRGSFIANCGSFPWTSQWKLFTFFIFFYTRCHTLAHIYLQQIHTKVHRNVLIHNFSICFLLSFIFVSPFIYFFYFYLTEQPRQLYMHTLENLTFSGVYKVGIIAKNTHNVAKESEMKWLMIQTPSCAEWYKYNFNICRKLKGKHNTLSHSLFTYMNI